MAILDIFKKKKKAPPSPPPPYPGETEEAPWPTPPTPAGELPMDQVRSLKDQGYANDQIITSLQNQGYDPVTIQNAIAQVDAGAAAGPVSEVPGLPPEGPPGIPSFEERMPPKKEAPAENVEEIAESIVEEKWEEFNKELGKITEWKDKSESRLVKAEQELEDLKDDVENLHKAIVAKIGEYDKNLLDVGTEIKAMEKVFQKVLPELTGSVSELSRITKGIKTKKKKA